VQLEGLDPDEAEEGLRKLGGTALPDGPGAVPLGAVPTPDSLLELFVAVLERRQVGFGYAGAQRRVQPHRLQFERGRWYLTGHDLDRDAARSFRLDRIEGTVSTSEPNAFDPPDEVPAVRLRPWELGGGPEQRARVLLDAEIARSVLNEDPGLSVIERRDDGSVVIELVVRNADALHQFVLSLLDRAELLSPAPLRQELIARLEALAELDPAGRPR
jgi:proteasome accessory factor B